MRHLTEWHSFFFLFFFSIPLKTEDLVSWHFYWITNTASYLLGYGVFTVSQTDDCVHGFVLMLGGGGGLVRLEISFNSCLDEIWDHCTLICMLTCVHVHLLIEAFCLRPLDHLIRNGLQEHCPDKVVLFVFCRWACVSRYLISDLSSRQIIVF